jgi:hypothetical protein
MPESDENNEGFFKEVVRRFISAGRHPSNKPLLVALGRPGDKIEFGLTRLQTRWRIEEVEAAGYDWDLSKRKGQLVRRG